ncbi:hypothetical protein WJX73_009213 [Symbiochloris irregularis]|uniref:Endonuclease/exonuclease/phosphatase domain-containing protein n=1 Tax=Symbiochloris irregularis TaxID=706552 RepID=A0AAW1NNX6_9CHLO
MQNQFTVVTLNCWGLLLVAKNRRKRLGYIAEWLRKSDADVAFLQEVWVQFDARAIARAAAEGPLKHSFHFVSGLFGAGLMVLSQHPIQTVQLLSFNAVGDPLAILSGDFYAGKGVGWARIKTPSHGEVDCFNTHTSAAYGFNWQEAKEVPGVLQPTDKNAAIRIAQMLQIIGFIHSRTGGTAHPIILAGDLNSPPESLETKLLQQLCPALQDTWLAANQGQESAAGATANTPDNTFGGTKGQGKKPIKIDYIWCSGHSAASQSQVLADRTPQGQSLSDHNGLTSTVTFEGHKAGAQWMIPQPTADLITTLELARTVLTTGHQQMKSGAIRGGGLAGFSLAATLILLGFQLSYPWWQYPRALVVQRLALTIGQIQTSPDQTNTRKSQQCSSQP